MAIVHYAIWGHGGAGIEEMKKKFDLPKNIYVAFYVPPGRMSGTALPRTPSTTPSATSTSPASTPS